MHAEQISKTNYSNFRRPAPDMKRTITISVLPGEEENRELVRRKAAEAISASEGEPTRANDITELVFRKKSIDARRGKIRLNLVYDAWIGERPPENAGTPGTAFAPRWKKVDSSRRVVIVGSGPAGLFAALRLLEDGITPIILERGATTSERKRDIAAITREGKINGESNYCFGEGGAGTFSDGKLYTRSNKRGDIGRVLSIFHWHGADEAILTDAHPHIGTDKLPGIINRMRETIVSSGGEFRFGTRCAGLALEEILRDATETAEGNAGPDGKFPALRVTGVITQTGETVSGDAVILATGHSAPDVYDMLSDIEKRIVATGRADAAQAQSVGPILEEKTFAMGVRVEHPRELIDRIQYHGQERGTVLPAAEYKLVAQSDGRGVYSFCMCPGGLVVPSATADDEIVVNGMSTSGRNGRWSNAAIVVEVRPEDIPAEFRKENDRLAGLRFRASVEREAKRQGSGQSAPAQRLVDFIAGRDSKSLPPCSYSPGVVPSRLDRWLPEHISDRLAEGFAEFGKNMRGFVCEDAILIAPETRTSSPVKIRRNKETFESPAIAGLYPAGEGAGQAGGIVSSAMDGENCAAAIIRRLRR